MSGDEVWTFHGASDTRVIAEDEHDYNVGDIDRMDEMIEAIQAEVIEDSPTAEIDAFFKLFNASEKPLHEHTEVTLLAFITRLMAIKSSISSPIIATMIS
jgi:DNA polymerase/3'-5' exonuclease PolX